LRAIGPLRSAEDSHALVEWAGQPGEQMVRSMINARAPFGILEMKSAWATDDPDRSHRITDAMARSAFHMMALLGNQFCMATAAAYALNRWRSSGGVVSAIPATPYPSERYQTKMMWWDRHDFVNHAKPEQVSKILTETQLLTQRFYQQSASGLRASTAT
jgi:glutathione S-transferase